jgi:hypothetical protein
MRKQRELCRKRQRKRQQEIMKTARQQLQTKKEKRTRKTKRERRSQTNKNLCPAMGELLTSIGGHKSWMR